MILPIAITLLLATFTTSDMQIHAGFYPPHNEMVVSHKVARYRLGADIRIGDRWWMESHMSLYGVQTWQPSSVVGNGIDSWQGSAWDVEGWKSESMWRMGRRFGHVSPFIEYTHRTGYTVPEGRYAALVGIMWER